MFLNMCSMTRGPKREVSICLRSGSGLQDSRSCVQDFLKNTTGSMKDSRRSKRLSAVKSLELGRILKNSRMGSRKCQTASSVPSKTKVTSRWSLILDWNWKNDTSLAMSCIGSEDSRGKPQTCTILTDANEKHSDSENKSMRKMKRTHVDHIAALEFNWVSIDSYYFLVKRHILSSST